MLSMQGSWVQSLVRELRSHMLHVMAKKINKHNKVIKKYNDEERPSADERFPQNSRRLRMMGACRHFVWRREESEGARRGYAWGFWPHANIKEISCRRTDTFFVASEDISWTSEVRRVIQ